jgi:hypothetical protein
MAFIRKKIHYCLAKIERSKEGTFHYYKDVDYYAVVDSVRVNGTIKQVHLIGLGQCHTIGERVAEIRRAMDGEDIQRNYRRRETCWAGFYGENEIQRLLAIQAETGLP